MILTQESRSSRTSNKTTRQARVFLRLKMTRLTFQKPSDGLSETARIRLDLPRVAPRQRLPNEAAPRIHVNASQRVGKGGSNSYTGAELKEAPARPGSMAAYQIKSRGF
jgi:hypothetical protein